jgi:hypothetical protein
MKEIFTFFAVLIGSYAAFMLVLVLFGRLFFPFYTKEQLEKRNAFVSPKQIDKRKENARKAIAKLKLKREAIMDRAVYSKFANGLHS